MEIGAGTRALRRRLRRACAGGDRVRARDTADEMLELDARNRPEVATGRMVPIKATETHVPLADGVADAVYMINLHHELADPAASYAEALRLLRPGGRLLAVDWAPRETPKGPPQEVAWTAETWRSCSSPQDSLGHRDRRATLVWHLMATDPSAVAGAPGGRSRQSCVPSDGRQAPSHDRAVELIAQPRPRVTAGRQAVHDVHRIGGQVERLGADDRIELRDDLRVA